MKNNAFMEGVHFYYNENGLMVLTEKYHLERGFCCGNGCLHCPYDYVNVPMPQKEILGAQRQQRKQKDAGE
jgi:Family of unknown function (DUF5522)